MGSMPSFPWTPQFNGILMAVVSPPTSVESSYWYINENGYEYWRGGSLNGLRYTIVMPIRKDSTYSTNASANVSIEHSQVFKFILGV